MAEKAININELKNSEFWAKMSPGVREQIESAQQKVKASNVTRKVVGDRYVSSPLDKKVKAATDESVRSLVSLVSKIMGTMSASAKIIENQFGNNISSRYLSMSKNFMSSKNTGGANPELATRSGFAAKLAATSFEAMTESSAKSFEEFKLYNSEFKSITSLAGEFANKMRQAGINVTRNTPFVKQLANETWHAAEGAFQINKATGETYQQGFLSQSELMTKKQGEWNKLAEKLPDWYTKAKEALTSTAASSVVFLGILIDKIKDSAEAVMTMRKELGLSVIQTAQMSLKMGDTMLKTAKWGGNAKDAAEALTALANYSGDLNMATSDAAANVAKMTILTKINANDAVKLNIAFLNTAQGTQKVADNLTNAAINTARLYDIAPQKLMGELAKNTEKFAGLTQDSVKSMIAGAASAVKLKVEFSKLVEVGENFLDVQNLIQETMSTNALLGTNFDLTKAAAKYNANDMKGFVTELTDQLKGVDLSKMTMIQKKQLSQTFGLSPEELQNIIKNADKLKNTTGDITMEMVKDAGKLDGIKHGVWDTLVGWASPQNLLMAITGGKVLSSIFKGFGTLLPGLVSKAKGLISKILPTSLTTATTVGETGANTVEKTASGLGKINPMKLIQGAAAMAIMAASVWILGKALQQFQGINWKTLAVAGTAIVGLSAVMIGLGAIAAGPIGVGMIVGAAALGIMSAALWVLGNALQEVAKSIPIFADGLARMVPSIIALTGLGGSMIAVGAGFAAMGAGLVPFAIGLAMLTPLIPVLSTLADISSVVFGGGEKSERTKSGSTKKSEMEVMSDNISQIKDFLLNGGAGIYIDGRKVGNWLGKLTSNINVLENGGNH